MNAFITDVERGSTVDGPGMRTVVFLKGCPLHCLWCHNPETIHREPEILRNLKLCIHCGRCGNLPVDRAVRECPVQAAERVGRELGLAEFFDTVLRDRWLFSGGGGVTFSGGEPLLQSDWVAEAARLCREKGIHTALDTTLCVPWERIDKFRQDIDLFMVDIKHWSDGEHRRLTGQGNKLILENLHRLDGLGASILTRTPLIPGLNDSPECIRSILGIAGSIRHLVRSEFLPYNPLTPFKYERLGRNYTLEVQGESDFVAIRRLLEQAGIPTLLAM